MIRSHLLTIAATLALISTQALAHPDHGNSLASGLQASDELVQTADLLKARVQARPGDPIALSKLGATQLAIARQTANHNAYADARETFDKLAQLDSTSANAVIGRAYSRIGLHQFKEALTDARTAANLGAGTHAKALLADVHLALGNDTEARALAESILADEITPESLGRLAILDLELGRFSQAEHTWLEAIEAAELLERDPSVTAWCLTMLGDTLRYSGKLDQASQRYKQAIALDPAAHAAAFGLATIASHDNDIDQAEAILIDLVERFPLIRYRIALGQAMLRHGEPQDLHDAAQLFQGVEAEVRAMLDHNDLGHARDLVSLWLSTEKHQDAAAELALRDLHEVRSDLETVEYAALTSAITGDSERAVSLAHQAIRRAPTHPRTMLRTGLVLCMAGNVGQGTALLQRAIDSGAPLASFEIHTANQILLRVGG